MNHIFINPENIQQLIDRLAASKPFQDGTFTLHEDVAVKQLENTGSGFPQCNDLDAHTACQRIDYLVCRQSEAVLAITFDIDSRESTALFQTVLQGLPHYGVNLLCFFSVDITDTLWQILQLLSDMAEEAGPVSPFSLRSCEDGVPQSGAG